MAIDILSEPSNPVGAAGRVSEGLIPETLEQEQMLHRKHGGSIVDTIMATHQFFDVLPEAFRMENIVASFLRDDLFGESGRVDPSFDAFSQPELTFGGKYLEFHEEFIDVHNQEEFDRTTRRIDRELSDRQILAEAGIPGILAQFTAGFLDPLVFLPLLGGTSKALKTGKLLKGSFMTSASAALGVGASEVGLQATQIDRTLGESALAVTAGAFLGGVLGLAGASLNRGRKALAILDIEERLLTGKRQIKFRSGNNEDIRLISQEDDPIIEITGNRITRDLDEGIGLTAESGEAQVLGLDTAVRNRATGEIFSAGPVAHADVIDGFNLKAEEVEAGFLDPDGNFLTRREAGFLAHQKLPEVFEVPDGRILEIELDSGERLHVLGKDTPLEAARVTLEGRKIRLRRALEMDDGRIVLEEADGLTHSDIFQRMSVSDQNSIAKSGWVDADGRFLTTAEASEFRPSVRMRLSELKRLNKQKIIC